MEHYKNLSLNNIDGEIWKDVLGYEGFFKISNFGRIKSMYRGVAYYKKRLRFIKEKILHQKIQQNGYLVVGLRKAGIKRKFVLIHRVVADSFLGINPIMQINHIDCNKKNNRIENLEWCTQKENNHHAIKNGLTNNVGVNNPKCVLTEIDVIEIRRLYDDGKRICEIVKNYPVQKPAIWKIVKKIYWKHLL